MPEELWMQVGDIVQEAVIKTIPKKKKCYGESESRILHDVPTDLYRHMIILSSDHNSRVFLIFSFAISGES